MNKFKDIFNADEINTLIEEKAYEAPYKIELSIPDECYKDIEVMLSPVYENGNETEINEFLTYESFLKLNKAKLMSEYAGQIKIDLCRKCKKCEKCERAQEAK